MTDLMQNLYTALNMGHRNAEIVPTPADLLASLDRCADYLERALSIETVDDNARQLMLDASAEVRRLKLLRVAAGAKSRASGG